MIRVCWYNGCGVIYGESEPLSDKRTTHGLCLKHLEISLKELKAKRNGITPPGLDHSLTAGQLVDIFKEHALGESRLRPSLNGKISFETK